VLGRTEAHEGASDGNGNPVETLWAPGHDLLPMAAKKALGATTTWNPANVFTITSRPSVDTQIQLLIDTANPAIN
jgi:hypothetical protein